TRHQQKPRITSARQKSCYYPYGSNSTARTKGITHPFLNDGRTIANYSSSFTSGCCEVAAPTSECSYILGFRSTIKMQLSLYHVCYTLVPALLMLLIRLFLLTATRDVLTFRPDALGFLKNTFTLLRHRVPSNIKTQLN